MKEFRVVRVAAQMEATESSMHLVGTGSKTDYIIENILLADPKLEMSRVGRG